MPAPWEALLVQAREAFTARFGGEPAVFGCAPGRVELLGNHTDYNGGLVMAAAIDRSTIVLGRRIDGREARFFSVNFDQSDTFPLDAIERTEAGSLAPICPRRLLGLDRIVRAARVGLRGGHPRRHPARARDYPARRASRPRSPGS